MAGPLTALVVARLRRRGSTVAISVAAVATAAALIAIVAGIGLIAADATVHRTLDGTGADRAVVTVSKFSPKRTDDPTTLALAQDAMNAQLGEVTGTHT